MSDLEMKKRIREVSNLISEFRAFLLDSIEDGSVNAEADAESIFLLGAETFIDMRDGDKTDKKDDDEKESENPCIFSAP